MAIPSSSRGGAAVSLVVIHTAEGSRTKESLGSYFNSGVEASSHVGIDAGGVRQYVDYSRAAWTLRSGNPVSDNAELCAFARWTRAQWLSTSPVDGCANPRQIVTNAALWAKGRCEARGIPKVRLSSADVAAGRRGICGHINWTEGKHDGTHTDPGPNFPWDVFMAIVTGSNPPEEEDMNQDQVNKLNDVWTGMGRILDEFYASAKAFDGKTMPERLAAVEDKLDSLDSSAAVPEVDYAKLAQALINELKGNTNG